MVNPIYLLIERLAILNRDAHPNATPYNSLTWRQQSWAWDHARSALQAAGIPVDTNANWFCPIAPPDAPPRSADDLLALLQAAKLNLDTVPPVVATAIMASLCFVGDSIDEMHEAQFWQEFNGWRP